MSQVGYYYRDGITFILTEEKTIISTKFQTFIVRYDHSNYIKRLENLRKMIANGKMKSLSELVTYCDYKPGGYKDQMSGLELVPTLLKRHI